MSQKPVRFSFNVDQSAPGSADGVAGIIDVLHTSVVGRNLNQQIFKAGECVLAVDGGVSRNDRLQLL